MQSVQVAPDGALFGRRQQHEYYQKIRKRLHGSPCPILAAVSPAPISGPAPSPIVKPSRTFYFQIEPPTDGLVRARLMQPAWQATVFRGPTRKLLIEHIQRLVADRHNVRRADMLSSGRTAGIVLPRQIAMYLARRLLLKSYPDIGRRFGGRDHTTVLHAVRKIDAERARSGDMRQHLNDLIAAMRSRYRLPIEPDDLALAEHLLR